MRGIFAGLIAGVLGQDPTCKAHLGCAMLDPLDGLCCPVADGTRLACCDAEPALIGGQDPWRYYYEPTKLVMPEGADPPYSHGLEVDAAGNLYLTYFDSADSDRCLVRWSPADSYRMPTVIGHGSEFCRHGDRFNGPHGLRIAEEADGTFFYHANNNRALFKTTLDGELVWSVYGANTSTIGCLHGTYCPTWFGLVPGADHVYMADGYGASEVHVYTKDGVHTGHTFGGHGKEHGQFRIPHAVGWDPRRKQVVVSDRSNHRLEYFNVDPADPSRFEYDSTTTVEGMGQVCNARFLGDNVVVPTLEGFVFVLDKDNRNVSTIDVKSLLGGLGDNHPHDAIFMPNGDIAVATWNPGRISYWSRLPSRDIIV